MFKKLAYPIIAMMLAILIYSCEQQDVDSPTLEISAGLNSEMQVLIVDYIRTNIVPETEKVIEGKKQLYSQYNIIYGQTKDQAIKIIGSSRQNKDTLVVDALESGHIDLIVKGEKQSTSYAFAYRLRLQQNNSNKWFISDCTSIILPEIIRSPQGDPPLPSNFDKLSDKVQNTEGNQKAPVLLGGSYNPTNSVNYAKKYAINPNPSYRKFSEDCTNFISQSVKAGGWSYVYGWYTSSNVWWYTSLSQSWTWAGAHNFYWFTKNSGRGSSLQYFSDLKLGDLLQIDFTRDGTVDHSMIVTQISDSKIYLSYHTPNTLNELLDNIRARNPNANFYGWRL